MRRYWPAVMISWSRLIAGDWVGPVGLLGEASLASGRAAGHAAARAAQRALTVT